MKIETKFWDFLFCFFEIFRPLIQLTFFIGYSRVLNETAKELRFVFMMVKLRIK